MILIRVRGDPQAILRSLIGHLSAQGVGRYLKGPLTTAVRNYFLGKTKPLPDGLWAFYWPILSRPHIMFRDAAYQCLRTGMKPFLMWLHKFFPVSFLLCWGEPQGVDCDDF